MQIAMDVVINPHDVLTRVLDLCKHTVSGPDGKIPEEMVGKFDTVQADADGNPLVNTLAGALIFNKGENKFFYTARVDAHIGTLATESFNLSRLLHELNAPVIVSVSHYIDATGTCFFGDEADKHHQLNVERETILRIKKYQDGKGSKLILPDNKILTR